MFLRRGTNLKLFVTSFSISLSQHYLHLIELDVLGTYKVTEIIDPNFWNASFVSRAAQGEARNYKPVYQSSIALKLSSVFIVASQMGMERALNLMSHLDLNDCSLSSYVHIWEMGRMILYFQTTVIRRLSLSIYLVIVNVFYYIIT